MSTLVVEAIENSSAENRFQPNAASAQDTTSGTAFDFTGIPDWVKRVTVVFDGVSVSGTDNLLVRLGDSGGFETTGYVSESGETRNGTTAAVSTSTVGFVLRVASASRTVSGTMVFIRADTNDWVSSHACRVNTTNTVSGGGSKTLSDTLTQIRITREGSDTFDAGQVNIIYE